MIHPIALILALAGFIGSALSQLQGYPSLYSGTSDTDRIEKFHDPLDTAWTWESNLIKFESWSDIPGKENKIPYTCTGAHDDWMKPYASSEFTVYEAWYMDCLEKTIVFCYHKNVNPALLTPNMMVKVGISLQRRWYLG